MAISFAPAHSTEKSRLYVAIAAALAVEALVFCGGYYLISREPAPLPVKPPAVLMLTAITPVPAAPSAPPTPAHPPVTPPTPPIPHVANALKPAHVSPHAPPHATRPVVTHSVPTPVPPLPQNAADVTAPAAPSAPLTPSPDSQAAAKAEQAAAHQAEATNAAQQASFDGAMRASVQAALQYPDSARMAGMSGKTRIAFDYRNGIVSNIALVTSSGMAVLDRAALAAVRAAHYPTPEAAQRDKTLHERIWVTFTLDNNDE